MKVLYINTLYPPDIGGGAEIALAAMIHGFVRRGQEASVLTTHGGSGVLRETVQGVPVYRVGHKNIYWHFPPQARAAWARTAWHALDSYNLPMARQVAALVDEIAPDLIVCHNLPGLSVSVWACAERRGIPIVQVLHDYYNLCPKVTMFSKGRPCVDRCGSCRVFRLPHRSASAAVSAVVGVSQAVLDAHVEQGLFSKARIKSVVHNARAMPVPQLRDPSDVFTFGYIGGITEIKGVQLLAEAFARFAKTSARPVQLLIAGTGKEELVADLRRAHAAPNIEFVGHVNAVEFFARLDVCVVPSLWNEPLGLVVFEAIASGVPVIGARRGGIPEIIRHEVNGLLFEPTESGALEQALERMAGNPGLLQAMRANGRNSVAHFLSEDRMLDEYEAVYRSVVERDAPAPPGVLAAAAAAEAANRAPVDVAPLGRE